MTVKPEFLVVLILYFLLTIIYSVVLKRFALVDCITLAILFTLRIISGGIACLLLSFWLLAFSVSFFCPGTCKALRRAWEQAQLVDSHVPGRGYKVSDASLIQTLGTSSGYLSVLVLALYMHSDSVASLYKKPEVIWCAVPLYLFWISWIWLKAHRVKCMMTLLFLP